MQEREINERDAAASDLVLIGVGNEFRSDDGLGLLVVREFRRRSFGGLMMREETGEGASLMHAWKGAEHVLLVDAVSSGAPPGMVYRLDASSIVIPRKFFNYSSHAFGLAEAIEMARELNILPSTTLIYGIEGEDFGAGIGLSASVLKSFPELIKMIETDLKKFTPV